VPLLAEPDPLGSGRPSTGGVLVERDGLVARLRGVRGRFVAVLGEAGAGKTALVQAGLTAAVNNG
jgi:hypothetical protein